MRNLNEYLMEGFEPEIEKLLKQVNIPYKTQSTKYQNYISIDGDVQFVKNKGVMRSNPAPRTFVPTSNAEGVEGWMLWITDTKKVKGLLDVLKDDGAPEVTNWKTEQWGTWKLLITPEWTPEIYIWYIKKELFS